MTKLERLDINNTDIDSGLEYLADTVRELKCSVEERPESKVKKIEEQLKSYNGYFLTWKLQIQGQRFQKQQSLFIEQVENIGYLEKRVQDLTNEIQKQKEKIIGAFLRLSPEKYLLKELIKVYLEFIKFKKCKLDSSGYDEECEKYEDKYQDIKKQLRIKLTKEEMDKIRSILTDCEGTSRLRIRIRRQA